MDYTAQCQDKSGDLKGCFTRLVCQDMQKH